MQNQDLPAKLSRHSSMKGNVYASFSLTAFTALKSMQYLHDQSRFLTSTGGETHSEWLCSITPADSIYANVAFSCFSKPKGVRCIHVPNHNALDHLIIMISEVRFLTYLQNHKIHLHELCSYMHYACNDDYQDNYFHHLWNNNGQCLHSWGG